jgi:hypothetical protein
MAEIYKKQLTDNQSNLFLEQNGFINISNSFNNSAWKHPGLNLILGIPFDCKVNDNVDLWRLLYLLGQQNGEAKTQLQNLVNNLK